MKNWIDIKAQTTRRNYARLSALILLPCVLVFGLYQVYRDIGALDKALHHYDAELANERQNIDLAHRAHSALQQQVQEWKDVLLRGDDAHLVLFHWAQFEQQEARVRVLLETLHAHALEAHDTEEAAEVQDALVLHRYIGKQYRDAVARFPPAQHAGNAFLIDRQVRGTDRTLAARLEHIATLGEQGYRLQAARLDAAQQAEIDRIRLRVKSTMLFILLMILVEAWLIFRKISSDENILRKLADQGEQTVYQLAYTDTLTGLPNRRLFQDRLEHAIALAHRTGLYGAILFLDLDNFKTLNDTKGHGAGDLLLIEVAKRLRACVRESDTVARLGGDEFVVILDDLANDEKAAAAQAAMIAQKISASLNRPYLLDRLTHNCSCSIGAALFSKGNESAEELLKRADTAMYQAKHAGRNTVRFFDPQTQAVLETRSELERALRMAVARQQLHLYYQLQVDESLRPIGAEALLRWTHPGLGTIPPDQFIPLAEETGLILPIGYWVLETACAQLKQWESNPATRELVLAVNVSGRQFREEDFVAQVKSQLASSGIIPSRLKLEITESMALHDVEHVIGTMRQLKDLGVNFSMDDFGTGHSSLSNLKRLPLDQIKIDQSFVHNLSTDSNDAAIVKAIIAMAASMKLDTLAEGVETEAQRQFLATCGCRAYQGDLFSKPVPLEQFERILLQHAG